MERLRVWYRDEEILISVVRAVVSGVSTGFTIGIEAHR